MYHYLHILASHKTDSQFSLSQLSICCLKLGHHISRHNYSQNLSETNLLSVAVPLLCMNSELSARQEEILKKLGEGGEEAAWIMRQGQTGRWETNMCLISQWWTQSGPSREDQACFWQMYYWLHISSQSLKYTLYLRGRKSVRDETWEAAAAG